MFKLQIRDDEGKATVVPLLRDEVTIGRKEGNTIRLTERNVSRRHAKLLRKEERLFIEDTSRYGTRINGLRISEATELDSGDVVEIGDYQLSIEIDEAKARAARDAKAESGDDGAVGGGTDIVNLDEIEKRRAAKGRRRQLYPRLVVVSSNLGGLELNVDKDHLRIGRTTESDLVIDHKSISRRHAEIKKEGGTFTLYDLGSANGIKVNGELYEQSALRRGDIIQLGHVHLRFVEPDEGFVYIPHDSTEEGTGRRALKLALLAALLLVAAGMTALWITYFMKPTPDANLPPEEAPATQVSPAAGGATAVSPATAISPATGAGAPAAVPAPTVQTPPAPSPEAVRATQLKAALYEAETHAGAENWDLAIAAYSRARAIDGSSEAAKSGLDKATKEKAIAGPFLKLKGLFERGIIDEAFDALQELDEVASDSTYYERAAKLRTEVSQTYAADIVRKGHEEMKRRQYAAAGRLADTALAIYPEGTAAKELKALALRKEKEKEKEKERDKDKDKERETDKPAVEPAKPDKPEPKADEGASASDIYSQARKLHNSDPAAALDLYKQAAQRGHKTAWRQMGSLYLKQGNKSEAIAAYKKYLKYAPGARDAETIRDTVIRLGGTF